MTNPVETLKHKITERSQKQKEKKIYRRKNSKPSFLEKLKQQWDGVSHPWNRNQCVNFNHSLHCWETIKKETPWNSMMRMRIIALPLGFLHSIWGNTYITWPTYIHMGYLHRPNTSKTLNEIKWIQKIRFSILLISINFLRILQPNLSFYKYTRANSSSLIRKFKHPWLRLTAMFLIPKSWKHSASPSFEGI